MWEELKSERQLKTEREREGEGDRQRQSATSAQNRENHFLKERRELMSFTIYAEFKKKTVLSTRLKLSFTDEYQRFPFVETFWLLNINFQMFASTTQQQTNDDESNTNRTMLLRSISTLDADDFNIFLQHHYGAFWGTLKFEDSLSDYSNDVRKFKSFGSHWFSFVFYWWSMFFIHLLDNAPLFWCKDDFINFSSLSIRGYTFFLVSEKQIIWFESFFFNSVSIIVSSWTSISTRIEFSPIFCFVDYLGSTISLRWWYHRSTCFTTFYDQRVEIEFS